MDTTAMTHLTTAGRRAVAAALLAAGAAACSSDRLLEVQDPDIINPENVANADGAEALRLYLAVVDDWRQLPFRDPGLPAEVLGDAWPGPEAVALFETLTRQLEGRALAHAAGFWPSS